MAHFLNNKPVDRLPIYFFNGAVGAKLAGMSYIESNETANNIARKEIETYNLLGVDQVSVNYGLYGLAKSFKSTFKTNYYGNSSINSYLLETINQFEDLDSDFLLFSKDQYQQKLYKALEIIIKEVGREVDVYFELPAPLTAAASLIEPVKLLRASRKEPDSVDRLLNFITDCLLQLIHNFKKIGRIGFSFMDPVSSGDLISSKQYRQLSLPYTKKVVETVNQLYPFNIIHICGDTTKILDAIAETGICGISVDQKVKLSKAVEIVGDRVVLIGNVDPISTILQGSSKEIYSDIKSGIEDIEGNNKGYIIAPGCSVPYDTCTENIHSFMKSAKELGQYSNHK